MTAAAWRQYEWRQFICRVCGLVYDEALGDADSGLAPGTRFEDIPDDWACPICGVGKADFEPHEPQARPARGASAARALASVVSVSMATMRRPRGYAADAGVLVVGAGTAGWQLVRALRERDADLPITLLTACSGDVYDKPMLSVAVARGLDPATLAREAGADAARRLGIRLLAHTHALHVDTRLKTLRTSRGTLHWRQLVLAHGAAPALPAVLPPGLVWRVNDLACYQRLRATLGPAPQQVAIVGAGLVGCELANDLALAGHRIMLLDMADRPLAAQLPPEASDRLLAAWQGLPIRFIGGARVVGVQLAAAVATAVPPAVDARAGDGTAAAPAPSDAGCDYTPRLQVMLQDAAPLGADLVIAATGLRTPGRLARSAGLAYDGTAGGIVVDPATGATSQPGIYALGDCVVLQGQASRTIAPIARQVRAVVDAIVGGTPSSAATTSEVLRIKTSALPIQISGSLLGPGQWLTDCNDAQQLRMRRLGADGKALATLVAKPPQHSSA